MLELQPSRCSGITTVQQFASACIQKIAKPLSVFQRAAHTTLPLGNIFRLSENWISRHIPQKEKQRMIQTALQKCSENTNYSLQGRLCALSQPERVISTIKRLAEPKLCRWASYSHFNAFKNILSFHSSIYHLNRKEIFGKQIGFINGMECSLDQARSDARKLSDNAAQSYNLHCVHAAARGNAVELLQQQWDEFFQNNPSEAKYLQICHSKGTIHVKSALEAMDEKLRERIIVVALAPAAFIPKGLCGKSYHYLIKKDPVPFFASGHQRILDAQDGEIFILPEHSDRSHPHDPHGPSYKQKVSEIVSSYLSS